MNKDTRGTIDFCENQGKPNVLMRCILWGKLEQNCIVVPYCEPFSYSVVHIDKYSNN